MTADDLVQKAAAALENAEGRDLLERNLQMSAVYEIVDRAATDLKQFRPERTAEIKTLSDYAAAIALRAGTSRALGQAQTGVMKSAVDVAKKFAITPTMGTVLASAPVVILLRWVGVHERIGESVGKAVGVLVVGLGWLRGANVSPSRQLGNGNSEPSYDPTEASEPIEYELPKAGSIQLLLPLVASHNTDGTYCLRAFDFLLRNAIGHLRQSKRPPRGLIDMDVRWTLRRRMQL